MKHWFSGRRVVLPMLGIATFVFAVQGLPAQERERDVPDDGPRTRALRAAPAPPAVMSLHTARSGSYLGVYIREVTEEDVERLDLREERGALVTEVPDDGPAAEAGLRSDDVIVSWNGDRVESAAQLRRLVGETPAGRSVELGFVRDGRQRTATVELGDRSRSASHWLPGVEMDDEIRSRLERSLDGARPHLRALRDREGGFFRLFMEGGRLGVGIQNLGDQLAEYFGASEGGVLVTTVREDSPAAEAGLRAGDVILRVGDERVEDPGDLTREVSRAEAGEIELRILRDRQERTIRATLPERPEGVRGPTSGNAYFFGPGSGAFEFELPRPPEIELVAPERPTRQELSVRT